MDLEYVGKNNKDAQEYAQEARYHATHDPWGEPFKTGYKYKVVGNKVYVIPPRKLKKIKIFGKYY